MKDAALEHLNITVSDCAATAARLCELFGWHVRWQGEALAGGTTVHVGTNERYLALYTPPESPADPIDNHTTLRGLNHIGVEVEDLDAVERKVIDMGYQPHMHADYEPGRRFYFDDRDGIEFEVVSYAAEN